MSGSAARAVTSSGHSGAARIGLGWNRGTPPAALRDVLTDRLATTDHFFEPMAAGVRGDVLLVAFAAQGPGMQQWAAPCAAARAAGVAVDALYLADPSNSYYLQDPAGGWGGVRYFERLIRAHTAGYARVLLVGSSMGGTAALLHAHLGHRAVSFGPRVDLDLTHGAHVPAEPRRACTARVRHALAVMHARGGRAAVHVGAGNAVDMMQARLVAHAPGLALHEHDTFHHNVPMFLEREGLLVPLLKRELLALLQG
ncbi:Hypothetical protein EMIHUDRAFT_448659 [Emiliania huxleyi CCMP1516]|uniref:AB hydrolase-1 domain-containing protein n=2 Tax=Emiliania huxleyi TaxID=2903 RepID=A0A0D3I2F1_EMIH1|nr:Hypothetical protein EMIHUDRAFT_448659 [Emiliania huxleyi CCMP1516]EOD05436.1 Hypothetical protein EMIHUDRAFT_448659 [Emiliania huxleyi CCMP1516]|eukprot:XP_005757865.1 Hypothetical protein EMIHUDRAFT_448659 [Emiliania huxleyi CCMP1516]